MSYRQALEQSSTLGKPIFVLFSAKWCGWCSKMKSNTLTNPQVRSAMENYVCLILDVDQPENGSVKTKFGVRGLPAYVITNSNQEKLKFGAGYHERPQDFADWLSEPDSLKQSIREESRTTDSKSTK